MTSATDTWLASDALRIGADGTPVLLASRCSHCDQVMFPQVAVCPGCADESLNTIELARSGKLYAFSKVYVGPAQWIKPFTLGYVDLPEGVRVFARITGERPTIDQTVTLEVEVIGKNADGSAIRNFVFHAATTP
jgi:uncharacterized OB-fold protein